MVDLDGIRFVLRLDLDRFCLNQPCTTSTPLDSTQQVLNHQIQLGIRQASNCVRHLYLVLLRHKQRQHFEVSRRVRLAHPRNGFLPMLPEVAQKRADDLFAELVTRAGLPSGRVASFPLQAGIARTPAGNEPG